MSSETFKTSLQHNVFKGDHMVAPESQENPPNTKDPYVRAFSRAGVRVEILLDLGRQTELSDLLVVVHSRNHL